MHEYLKLSETQKIIIRNLHEFWKHVASTGVIAAIETDNFFLINNVDPNYHYVGDIKNLNIKEALLNPVFYLRATNQNVHECIQKILKIYREKNLPICWLVGPDSFPTTIDELLTRYGLNQSMDLDGIFADINPELTKITIPADVKLVCVDKKTQFKDWIRPIQYVYKMSDLATECYRKVFEELFAKTNAFKHYISYYQGEPIASSTLFLGSDSAGLYNRASLPLSAKLGYRLALTTMIGNELNEAVKLGYRHATSQCAPRVTRAIRNFNFKAYLTFKIFYGI